MSMFEIVFGSGGAWGAIVSKFIGNVGRFRDAWIEKRPEDDPVLAVYTRNGGGNREHHGDGSEGVGCSCTGCIITHAMPAHPFYIEDRDDDFDSTYCTIYFRMPPELAKVLDEVDAEWRSKVSDPVNMSDVWQKRIVNINKPTGGAL